MKTARSIFVDTNVLVYAADKRSPFQNQAKAIRQQGLKGDMYLCISPQVLNEFYATITHPKRVDTPLSQTKALEEIDKYFKATNIQKIYPTELTVTIFLDLLSNYTVTKQAIHDLNIVATMLTYKVTHLYTYNTQDFGKFKEITVLSHDEITVS